MQTPFLPTPLARDLLDDGPELEHGAERDLSREEGRREHQERHDGAELREVAREHAQDLEGVPLAVLGSRPQNSWKFERISTATLRRPLKKISQPIRIPDVQLPFFLDVQHKCPRRGACPGFRKVQKEDVS